MVYINKHYGALASLGLLALTFCLQGCAPVAVFGGAAAVGTSAAEERGITGVFSDTQIKTRLNFIYSSRDPDLFSDVDIVVRQGRVLLTGTVETLEKQINAVRYAWEVPGVKEVIDELKVGEADDLSKTAKDAWITTQLKTKLLFDGEVASVNYTLQTVNQVLYVMGVAQDQRELERVLDIARHIEGVKKVVNYAEVKTPALHFKEDGSFESPLKEESSYPQAGGDPYQAHQTLGSSGQAVQRAQPPQPAQSAQSAASLKRPNRSSAFD